MVVTVLISVAAVLLLSLRLPRLTQMSLGSPLFTPLILSMLLLWGVLLVALQRFLERKDDHHGGGRQESRSTSDTLGLLFALIMLVFIATLLYRYGDVAVPFGILGCALGALLVLFSAFRLVPAAQEVVPSIGIVLTPVVIMLAWGTFREGHWSNGLAWYGPLCLTGTSISSEIRATACNTDQQEFWGGGTILIICLLYTIVVSLRVLTNRRAPSSN